MYPSWKLIIQLLSKICCKEYFPNTKTKISMCMHYVRTFFISYYVTDIQNRSCDSNCLLMSTWLWSVLGSSLNQVICMQFFFSWGNFFLLLRFSEFPFLLFLNSTQRFFESPYYLFWILLLYVWLVWAWTWRTSHILTWWHNNAHNEEQQIQPTHP